MKRFVLILVFLLLLAPTAHSVYGVSMKFTSVSGLADYFIFIASTSSVADEFWYFKECSGSLADEYVAIATVSSVADKFIYPTQNVGMADKIVCVVGEVPEELQEHINR